MPDAAAAGAATGADATATAPWPLRSDAWDEAGAFDTGAGVRAGAAA